jgi:hypothetical protein
MVLRLYWKPVGQVRAARPGARKFWARGPRRRDGLRLRVSPSSASVPLTRLLVASDCCCCGCCCCPRQQQRLTTTHTFCLYFFVEDPAHVVAVAGKAVLMPCHHRSPLRSTTRSASPTCGPGLRAASGTSECSSPRPQLLASAIAGLAHGRPCLGVTAAPSARDGLTGSRPQQS